MKECAKQIAGILSINRPYTTVDISLSQAIHASRKSKFESDSNADTSVVGDGCLIIYDHEWPLICMVIIPKIGLKSAMIIDVIAGYDDQYSGTMFFITIK